MRKVLFPRLWIAHFCTGKFGGCPLIVVLTKEMLQKNLSRYCSLLRCCSLVIQQAKRAGSVLVAEWLQKNKPDVETTGLSVLCT